MSPTPVTTSLPTAPVGYSWEATDEQVAERYGVPIERVVRFDLNTSPAPPDLVDRILAAGRFETRLSEYPPSDYRRLVAAAAARYGVAPEELIVGAGADEILDLVAKTFLPAGGDRRHPDPVVRDVPGPQRAARCDRPGGAPVRTRARATRSTAPRCSRPRPMPQLVWLCSPEQPDRPARTRWVDRGRSSTACSSRPGSPAGRRPSAASTRPTPSSSGRAWSTLRADYPRLVVVRTLSKAYALAGLRVGFAIATRAIIAAMEPYRPPGSVSTVSVTIATEALLDPAILDENLARVAAERDRLSTALRELGWVPGPSVTNFLLVDFGTASRAATAAEGLLRRGLVPRTFPAGHPLAGHLRLTVRSAQEDDRLIAAAGEIAIEPAEDAT